MKLLLFDIDGTLLLTGGAGIRAMERAGRELFGARFSLRDVTVSGGLDPVLYAEAARRAAIGDPMRHHDRFRDRYLVALAEELDSAAADVRVLPGVTSLLAKLRRDPRVALGLVSGNYRQAAPLKLRAAGIDAAQFRWQALGDEAPDRPSLVALAMERYRTETGQALAARDVIVIGDTPRDVACARAHGCICLGVATGRYAPNQLMTAGADAVAKDLEDPGPLLAFLHEFQA